MNNLSKGDAGKLYEVKIVKREIHHWSQLKNAPLSKNNEHGIIKKLTKGGVLAVQMPDNLDEHTHRLMRLTAANGSWAEKLASAAGRLPRQGAEWYYQNLRSSV